MATFVQAAYNHGASPPVSTNVFTATAGNFIAVMIAVGNASEQTVSNVVDSFGNSYTRATGSHVFGSGVNGGTAIEWWYKENISGGTGVVTASWAAAGGYAYIYAFEYSGVMSVSDPLDNIAIVTQTTGTRTVSITDSGVVDLILSHFVDSAGATADSPATNITVADFDGFPFENFKVVQLLNASSGANTVSMTGGSGNYIASAVSFKNAAINATATPSGVTSAFLQNDPSGTGSALVIATGVTSAFTEYNPVGNPAGCPAGVTSVFAEHNPSSTGDATATPSGVTAAFLQHAPSGSGGATAIVLGVTAAFNEHSPTINPSACPAGVTASFAEHNPTIYAINVSAQFSAPSGDPLSFGYVIVNLVSDAKSPIGELHTQNAKITLDVYGMGDFSSLQVLSSLSNNLGRADTIQYHMVAYTRLGERVWEGTLDITN